MFQGPGFIVAIVGLSMAAWVVTTWIRARHGYPLTDDNGDTIHKGGIEEQRKVELIANENGQLKDKVVRLEERIAVLERIATDQPSRLSAEIERLR